MSEASPQSGLARSENNARNKQFKTPNPVNQMEPVSYLSIRSWIKASRFLPKQKRLFKSDSKSRQKNID